MKLIFLYSYYLNNLYTDNINKLFYGDYFQSYEIIKNENNVIYSQNVHIDLKYNIISSLPFVKFFDNLEQASDFIINLLLVIFFVSITLITYSFKNKRIDKMKFK